MKANQFLTDVRVSSLVLAALLAMGCSGPVEPPGEQQSSLGRAHAALTGETPTCVTFQQGLHGQVADAKISSRQPDKNFGKEPVASVSGVNGEVEQVLLRFDTSGIPQQAHLTSATLTPWQVNSGRPMALRAHAITRPWAEDSVTWRSFGAAFDASAADLPSLVASWVREPASNHGLLLAQSEGKTLLDTSQSPHASRRPRLEVCYTLVRATPPAGTSVFLEVVDGAGNAIASAAISAQGAVFPTDGSGHLLLENLPAGRFLARVDALGFTSSSVVLELQEGAHAGSRVTLLPLSNPVPFQAEAGAIIQTEGVRVTLPPNAVVDALGQPVTGTVELTVAPLDPTTQLAAMPGPLEATAATGDTVQLESFFMAEVSLWSNGAPAQLAPGASATLEFILPDSLASQFQPGDSVPAWWFDLDAGQWREEGAGTVQPSASQPGKLAWVVTVHHFTWWNCDQPWTDKSCVDVQVLARNGQPVPNAQVTAEGVSYAGISYGRYTGADGRACTEIKRGHTANVFAGLPGQPATAVVSVTGTQQAAVCGTGPCTSVTLVMQDVICAPGAYETCPYSGPEGTQGVGMCRASRRQCNVTGTQWSACQGEVVPASESCKTPFDDDCDGTQNEDCTCSDMVGMSCYTGPTDTQGVGSCQAGAVSCDLFGNVMCQGQQLPRKESCATPEDEDCDGSTECEPSTRWSRHWPGTGCEELLDLVMDGAGNALVLGRLEGTLDLGGTSLIGTNKDLYVAKVDASGQRAWSQLLRRQDIPWRSEQQDALSVDGAGNVLLTGTFSGTMSVGGVSLTSTASSSLFVVKLSPAGDVLWARSFGDTPGSHAWSTRLAADSTGNVVVVGSFTGTLRLGDQEHTTGSLDYSPEHLFTVKLAAGTGEPLWSRSFSGTGGKHSDAVTVDAAGDVVVSGTFIETLDLGGVQLHSSLAIPEYPEMGSWFFDAFVAKLDGATGTTLWGKSMGEGWVNERGQNLRVDAAGQLLLLMRNRASWGGGDSFSLAKLDANGAPLWSRSLSGNSYRSNPRMTLAFDASGNVLLSGYVLSGMDFGGGYRDSPIGAYIAFLAWYSPQGEYLSDKTFGGWANETSYSVPLGAGAGFDASGNVVFAGWFWGSMELGGTTVEAQSCTDIFLMKLDPTP